MTEQLLLECEQFIRNGGILTGSSFGRIEIPFCKMMDIDTDDAEQYLQQHRENTFAEQMFAFIDRTGQKDSDIYKKAMIDRRLFSKISTAQVVTCSHITIPSSRQRNPGPSRTAHFPNRPRNLSALL